MQAAAQRSATAPQKRGLYMASGLPCGRRTPKGVLRWYLVEAPEGKEQALCQRVKQAVSEEILQDAFCIERERWTKRADGWSTVQLPMYKGLFFAATTDAAALAKALAKLGSAVKLVGVPGKAWMPLADDVRDWFELAMDSEHVIRSSTAVMVDGQLRVQEGPLVGQESRIGKLDRHKRSCLVRLSDADGGYVKRMPLDILSEN